MPKFTKREKELIHQKLIETGKRLFASFGLKKTNVEDLTKGTGIAQGSFYLFYGSKEELYFEIIQQEEATIREQLSERYFTGEQATKESFKQFLRESVNIIKDNPFIQQMYNEDLMETVLRKLPPEKLERHFADDADYFMPLLLHAQEQGWLIRENPKTIIQMLRSIIMQSLQRGQADDQLHEEAMNLLIGLVAEGLMVKG